MKILFIYPDIGSSVGFSSGIAILSSVLKKGGHQTKLLHVSDDLDYSFDLDRIVLDIKNFEPDLICLSLTTNQWEISKKIGNKIKSELNIPIIVGGIHATSDPENVIKETWVDLLCRGEGEHVLLEVVKRLDKKFNFSGIPNLIHKQNGKFIKEPLISFVEDLDFLPYEDWDLFNYKKIIDTRSGWAEIIVTRGCPFPCTYCFNRSLFFKYKRDSRVHKKISLSLKTYVRRRSVNNVIKMLSKLKSSFPNIKGFTFTDDILAGEGDWFEEFSKRYPNEVGLPYACTSQPLMFTKKVAKLLHRSGCKVVKLGIESGNYRIRKSLLHRNITDNQLINIFNIAKEFSLKPQSFNMIGLPGETFVDMMDTVRLNAKIKPYIVWLSTYNPYPGTILYKKCVEKKLIDNSKWKTVNSYRGDSVFYDNILHPLEFLKFRTLFRWHLNHSLSNESKKIYRENIKEFLTLPNNLWENGQVENLFIERDYEIDQLLRKKSIDHYVSKKYINIYWGKEYDYDLS